MKQLFAFVIAITITTTAFSQAGQKWSTSGNSTTSGDFIGSINYEPLVFRTNNNHQGMFTANGDFQLTSLKGMGFSLIQTDASGIVSKFPMSTANEVLYGDGIWRPLPTPPPSTWELNGTSLFYLNGKVGIGTKTPFTNFDVIGDAYISNNLYVGGGIIITEKVNANVEVVTSKLKADTIFMDSTKAVYGYSVFKDQVRLENKLQVVGNTQIDGNLRLNGELSFGNNKRLGYLPPSGGDPEVISFGGFPLSPLPNLPCLFPASNVPIVNQFGGMIQLINYSIPSLGGTRNILNMGFDGANGIIDMSGTNTQGGPSLLINYYCGKDIFMNTGTNGGNVVMTTSTMGMVGIGISTPTAKLDVVGSFRLNDGSQGANKVLVSDADGIASWQDPSTIEDGDWTINGNDIYRLTGNIGIGTTTPTKTLDVSGTLRVGDGNTNFLDIWYDGAHNIIDAKGADLLINYYANKNCVIGPGSLTASGVFTAQKDAYFATTSGNVGIGTITPQAKLEVSTDATQGGKSMAVVDNVSGMDVFRVMNNGNIFATELTRKLKGQFPDYVFAKDYQLLSFSELGLFISKNKHLPNIPNAKDVEKNGLSIGEMQAKQMEKIEELTLYILELNKRLSSLEKENKNLKENK